MNQNLAGNTDIHRTIVQNASIPDISLMIQALNLQNPEFLEILKNNLTIPAPVKEDDDEKPHAKVAGDDDTTVPYEVQSSLSRGDFSRPCKNVQKQQFAELVFLIIFSLWISYNILKMFVK